MVRRRPGPHHYRQTETSLPSAEFVFLVASLRCYFQPDTQLPSPSGLDWPRLISLADRHAVLGLFCHAIPACSDIPAAVLDDLRQRARDAAMFDLILSRELVGILGSFEEHRIPVVALKGPVLGAMLYGNAALRTSTDLDLLVHEHDVLRAKAVLEDGGYLLESVLPWSDSGACLRCRDSQLSFANRVRGVAVDLHWRLSPRYFPISFNDGDAWRDLRNAPAWGDSVRVLSREHLLLFLCSHGARHLWDRLAWVCDLAQLLRVDPDQDWNRVFSRAGKAGTSRMVAVGLLLASNLMGSTLPESAAAHVNCTPHARALAEQIQKRLHLEVMRPASAVEAAFFGRSVFERGSHFVYFLFGVFAEPTEAEYELLRLPRGLHWLYYLVRPVRLAAKHTHRWFEDWRTIR